MGGGRGWSGEEGMIWAWRWRWGDLDMKSHVTQYLDLRDGIVSWALEEALVLLGARWADPLGIITGEFGRCKAAPGKVPLAREPTYRAVYIHS